MNNKSLKVRIARHLMAVIDALCEVDKLRHISGVARTN